MTTRTLVTSPEIGGIGQRFGIPSRVVLSRRAQKLIVDSCMASGARTILVPALYCSDIVVAIRAAGLEVRYYDITPDLAPSVSSLDKRLDKGCAVIWHHPFGSYAAPPAYPGLLVIEDSCYSFRTISSLGISYDQPELCICSLRKEFDLSVGGIAFGHMVDRLRPPRGGTDRQVLTEWSRIDLARWVKNGQVMTQLIREAMAEKLPPVTNSASVLSQIPLISARRDDIVAGLRAAGVPAWYWQLRTPDLTRNEAPVAWELWTRLFLVPLPHVDSRLLDMITCVPADRW